MTMRSDDVRTSVAARPRQAGETPMPIMFGDGHDMCDLLLWSDCIDDPSPTVPQPGSPAFVASSPVEE